MFRLWFIYKSFIFLTLKSFLSTFTFFLLFTVIFNSMYL